MMSLSRSSRHAAFVAPARRRPQIWRVAVGLPVILAVYLGSLAAAFAVYAATQGIDAAESLIAAMAVASSPRSLLLVLATFLPIFAGVWLAVRLLHKRSLVSVIGHAPRALQDFLRAVAVFSVVYGIALGLFVMTGATLPNLPLSIWLLLLPLTLVALLVQTGAEELLFRGYLQQQLAARFRSPVIWALLPSVLFGFLHLDPERMGETAPFAVAAATIFGLIAAELTVRAGNLGAAWGAHFTNNFFAVALVGVDGTLTGLALRVTNYRIDEVSPTPLMMLSDLLPMILAWLLLRRWLAVR